MIRAKELLDVLEDEVQLKALLKQQRQSTFLKKMKVIDAINTLRTSKGSLVLVNDEFGNIQGLISPLDVFEAIAGEFPDADEQLELVKIDDTTWKAAGSLDLYQLELELGMLDLVEDDADYVSVAGLILDKIQDKITVGTQLDFRGVHFEVTELKVTESRLFRLHIIHNLVF